MAKVITDANFAETLNTEMPVMVDFWATWCGPCKQEMPYLKQLEKQFEDASIVFLGLSVDRDKSKWEEMARSGNLTGVQLYLGTQSSFQEAYRAESIPRFILLDKEGKIISNPCRNCGGSGLVRKRETIKVKIPAGVEAGMQLTIQGQGHAAKNNAKKGSRFQYSVLAPKVSKVMV